MTDKERQLLTRRAMFRRAAFLTGTEVIPALSVDNPAVAEQKVPRGLLRYHERETSQCNCAHCALFMPGEHPDAAGVCRLVSGVISPTAACDAFAPATGSRSA